MTTSSQLVAIFAETALHPGTGQGDGVIDREVQRDITTGHPEIAGSSWKGALKAHVREATDDATATRLFGSDPGEPVSDGRLAVSAGSICAFPVPIDATGFGWITSLSALAQITLIARPTGVSVPGLPDQPDDHAALGPASTPNDVRAEIVTFKATPDAAVTEWAQWIADHAMPPNPEFSYWRAKAADALWVVSDAAFPLMTRQFTQIDEQVALDSKKNVVGKALRTVEYLPRDTIMMSRVDGAENDVSEFTGIMTRSGPAVVGGDESTGKGVVWISTPRPPVAATVVADSSAAVA